MAQVTLPFSSHSDSDRPVGQGGGEDLSDSWCVLTAVLGILEARTSQEDLGLACAVCLLCVDAGHLRWGARLLAAPLAEGGMQWQQACERKGQAHRSWVSHLETPLLSVPALGNQLPGPEPGRKLLDLTAVAPSGTGLWRVWRRQGTYLLG